MKNRILLLVCFFFVYGGMSGQSRLHIHFVSHNEPNDNLQQPFLYQKAKNNLLQMADLVKKYNMAWNIQTSDGMVIGARTDQQNNGNNIFRQLQTSYGPCIEIDPRNKNLPGRNIADQWYLLDSLGAQPSLNVGGFLYTVCNGNTSLIDWWPYQDTMVGLYYKNKVKFKLLSGAGSLPPHCDDLNDFGIFKPDTINNFYRHNPNRNIWCMGTGCAPLLDSTSDELAIWTLIKGQADSIAKGMWPMNKFYVTRIMTNQRSYGPLFFKKVNRLMDSLATLDTNQLKWSTISHTFHAFAAWQKAQSADFSQWQCGEKWNMSIEKSVLQSKINIYPNPGSDLVWLEPNQNEGLVMVYNQLGEKMGTFPAGVSQWIDASLWSPGIYYFVSDQGNHASWVKQ